MDCVPIMERKDVFPSDAIIMIIFFCHFLSQILIYYPKDRNYYLLLDVLMPCLFIFALFVCEIKKLTRVSFEMLFGKGVLGCIGFSGIFLVCRILWTACRLRSTSRTVLNNNKLGTIWLKLHLGHYSKFVALQKGFSSWFLF